MLDILIDDCINNIKSHLSYIDMLCYKMTCKSNYNKIKLPNFKDVFIKRLLEHNIVPSLQDAEVLCDNLYNTGAYVAGSFILDCLFNTNFHHDIDIYDQTGFDLIPKRNETFLHECCQEEKDRKYEYYNTDKFYKYKGSDPNPKNLPFTQSLYKLNFINLTSVGSPDPIIRSFLHASNPIAKRGYKYNKYDDIENNSIQIIPIDLKPYPNERSFIPRFIRLTFDLDICQNIFDGKRLQIKNLNKLIHKYDYIKPNTRFMLSVYQQDERDEEENTKNRMNKYLERGFDIKLHPEYDKINIFIINTLKLKKYNLFGHQNCIINDPNSFDYQNNIKYIDNGEINLGLFDID